MMEVRINGKSCACEPGEYLINVAGRNGFDVPTFCHHEGLRGQGCCRVCVVEMDGRVVPACVTRLESECEVTTDSEKVLEIRKVVLALLTMRSPLSEEVAELARRYNAPALTRLKALEDNDRCVLCGLCVRACKSLGTGAISAVNRGVNKKIAPPFEEEPESCIGCASCAEVCPVNAISVDQTPETRTIWDRVFAMQSCSRCGESFTTQIAARHVGEGVGLNRVTLCPGCRTARIGTEMRNFRKRA